MTIIEQEYRVILAEGDDDDKQDNDSGIQNDEKEDEEEEKIIKKREKIKDSNKKPSFKIKSPKKLSNGSIRSKSPSKNGLSSPEKSPKKRRKKFPPKPEKKDHDGTIVANPHFDAERTAQRYMI